MGEPSGVGPEVAVKAWAALGGKVGGRPLHLVGNVDVYRAAAASCGIDPQSIRDALVAVGPSLEWVPGRPSPTSAAAVTAAIVECVRRAQAGTAAALVSAPIQKSALAAAGFAYPGHTEYLAALTGTKHPVMMLVSHEISPPLRVVPLTIHIPLHKVPAALSLAGLVMTAEIVLAALRDDFGLKAPRLAIAGLNPHAGEDGTMGLEERETIIPAVEMLRLRGHAVTGPHPADTLFHDQARSTYDAALCMYHDQALIPIKTLSFWTGINMTLGLPIIRTSPDHGTALDIAGCGVANEKSMIAAIELAAETADRRGR